jgi:hypothetical protein
MFRLKYEADYENNKKKFTAALFRFVSAISPQMVTYFNRNM